MIGKDVKPWNRPRTSSTVKATETTWITRIAVNVCKSYLRSPWKRRRAPAEELDTMFAPSAVPAVDNTLPHAILALSDSGITCVYVEIQDKTGNRLNGDYDVQIEIDHPQDDAPVHLGTMSDRISYDAQTHTALYQAPDLAASRQRTRQRRLMYGCLIRRWKPNTSPPASGRSMSHWNARMSGNSILPKPLADIVCLPCTYLKSACRC